MGQEGDQLRLVIPLGREEAFAHLLLDAGIPVTELCRNERSLEQFFLEATGGSERTLGQPAARRRWFGFRNSEKGEVR